jgi:hypothetical protein
MHLLTSVTDNGSILVFGNVATFNPLLDLPVGFWTGEYANSDISFICDLNRNGIDLAQKQGGGWEARNPSSVGSRPSCATTVGRPRDRTRPGRWNFVHDQLATGHKLWVLTIVDIFSRFSPALCETEVWTSNS